MTKHPIPFPDDFSRPKNSESDVERLPLVLVGFRRTHSQLVGIGQGRLVKNKFYWVWNVPTLKL